jgi:hypothetical protein
MRRPSARGFPARASWACRSPGTRSSARTSAAVPTGSSRRSSAGRRPRPATGHGPIPPAPVAPTRLALVAGATPATRTLTAVRATLADVTRQFLGDAIAAEQSPRPGSRVPGLRSGVATWTAAGIRLHGVQYVPWCRGLGPAATACRREHAHRPRTRGRAGQAAPRRRRPAARAAWRPGRRGHDRQRRSGRARAFGLRRPGKRNVMANALAQETSPYLRQHQDNPVDWLPWGPQALGRAREEDRPLHGLDRLLGPATGATSWSARASRTPRRRGS